MLRRCTGLVGLKEMGKNGASFDMNEHSLYRFQAGGHRLEIAPGYITSVRRYESAMLMNIYSLHKVFRKEKVSEVMARIWNSVPKNQVHDKVSVFLRLLMFFEILVICEGFFFYLCV